MADTSQIAQIRERVDRVLATRHDELYERVRACVAEALAIDPAKVVPTASLIEDLGAESLDFLDLVFRLETEYGVKIPRDGILLAARDGLAGGFDERGGLSSDALDRVRLVVPGGGPGGGRP